MKRGEIWVVAGGPGYAGKPRPAAIIQDNAFDGLASVAICPLTTTLRDTPNVRLAVEPAEINGLRKSSQLMVDKIGTVPRLRCQTRIGSLSDADMLRLNQALVVFLGLAGASRS